MSRHARPLVVISRCIDFDACRYNGKVIRASLRDELEPHVDFAPICPELEIGLGVPRDPIRIVARAGERLVQPSTGRDLTGAMDSFSKRHLSAAGDVDGFILKSRSPSCAVRDAHRHLDEESDRSTGTGPGVFARHVLERFPHAAVEDEARLQDPPTRHHFLTRLFVLAAFREACAAGDRAALARFHERHEPLIAAHDPGAVARMEVLLADPGPYRRALAAALSETAPDPYAPPYPPELIR